MKGYTTRAPCNYKGLIIIIIQIMSISDNYFTSPNCALYHIRAMFALLPPIKKPPATAGG